MAVSQVPKCKSQAFGRVTIGVTFDAGGLIALDRTDRRVLVLLARATEVDAHVTVPATALAPRGATPARAGTKENRADPGQGDASTDARGYQLP